MPALRRFGLAVFLFLLAPALFSAAVDSTSFAVEVGATKEQVLRAYAPPQSKAQNGPREIFVYKEGSIVLENGIVTEVRFPKGEPKRLPTPTPTPTPPVTATPAVEGDAIRTVSAAPKVEAKPAIDPLYLKIGGGIVLVVLIVIFHRATRPRESDVRERIRAAATKKAEPAAPPPLAATTPPKAAPAAQEAPRQRLVLNKAAASLLDRHGLERLEWRRLEELVEAYFVKQGWSPARGEIAQSGTVGYLLTKANVATPSALALVKRQRAQDEVSVRVVKEAHGLMQAEGLAEAFVVTNGTFTADALQFAEGKSLTLLAGDELLRRFAQFPEAVQKEIVTYVFRDDCETPTCPSCDVKMTLSGGEEREWVCRNAPRCSEKIRG